MQVEDTDWFDSGKLSDPINTIEVLFMSHARININLFLLF